MNILKKTYSKNNNEIVLVESELRAEGEGLAVSACASKTSRAIGSPVNHEQPRTNLGRCIAKTILIIGVVHGDEPQGKFLIENYLDKETETHVLPRPYGERVGVRGQKNKLLFIPCLNPDGLELKTRQNANKVDLNRNFPTANWELTKKNDYFGGESANSEIETKFVVEIIEEFSPDIILTLHAPYKVVNYDGPSKEIAEEISKIINYPTSTDIGYPTPGSFGTYAGIERHIPTITLELDEEIDVNELTAPINKIFDLLATQL